MLAQLYYLYNYIMLHNNITLAYTKVIMVW